jgi:hypothetical protein
MAVADTTPNNVYSENDYLRLLDLQHNQIFPKVIPYFHLVI